MIPFSLPAIKKCFRFFVELIYIHGVWRKAVSVYIDRQHVTLLKDVKGTRILHPVGNYMFKVNNRNSRARYKICSKLTTKTPERSQWRRYFFIVNFENISHLVLRFLLLTLNRKMPA